MCALHLTGYTLLSSTVFASGCWWMLEQNAIRLSKLSFIRLRENMSVFIFIAYESYNQHIDTHTHIHTLSWIVFVFYIFVYKLARMQKRCENKHDHITSHHFLSHANNVFSSSSSLLEMALFGQGFSIEFSFFFTFPNTPLRFIIFVLNIRTQNIHFLQKSHRKHSYFACETFKYP